MNAPTPLYSCSVCGLAVLVLAEETGGFVRAVRGCVHADAPIVANARATCAGHGGVTVAPRKSA